MAHPWEWEREVIRRVKEALAGRVDLDPELRRDFELLIADEMAKVYGLVLRQVGDEQVAAELAQEAFLTAYRKLATFEGDSRFGTWVGGIAKNLAFNARRRRTELLLEDQVFEESSPELPALKVLSRHEREEVLRQAAVACLDQLEQEAVHLRYVEGLDVNQITALLQVEGASGARGLLQRCRNKLRKALEERLRELDHGLSFIRTSLS